MAFNGYLIKLGGLSGTILPMKYMKLAGYNSTPDQRMESDAKRAVTGLLHRTTVEHTATKVEFNTPMMTNMEVADMMSLFRNAWTSNSERKLDLEYYDEETDSDKVGTFYMPDIKFPIDHIDLEHNIVYYGEIRIAFIED
jgi:hypothetical protein